MGSPDLLDVANTFSYTPLADPKSQIRLLTIPLDIKLYVGSLNFGPLTGTLTTHDIPVGTMSRAKRLTRAFRLPLFYALSYVWGDPTKCHEIWIDGKRLAITQNLYLALRSMQSGDTGTLHVWADAICINQEENSEKSAQIQLMREIYNSASEVRVWLGVGTPETKRCLRFIIDLTKSSTLIEDEPSRTEDDEIELALARVFVPPLGTFLRRTNRFAQGFIDFGEIFVPPSARDDRAEVTDPEGELSLNQSSIHALRKWTPHNSALKAVEKREGDFIEVAKLIDKVFIQQVWFTRMWVVQEVCCARSCQLQVGRTALDWDDFIKTVHYLHFHRGAHLDNIRKYVAFFLPSLFKSFHCGLLLLKNCDVLIRDQNNRARNNPSWLDRRNTTVAQRFNPRNPLQGSHRSEG